ncbi:MAG TPA: hypothetical protein VK809_09160 [Bacteroidia bacterium]|jgi:hypothetical protein|nr:hypothetical protein [Bacteroidia bacterium]
MNNKPYEEFEEKRHARFSIADSVSEPVVVKRLRNNGKEEIIGYIRMDFSSTDESAVFYTTYDRNEKPLFAPTSDYSEAESRFERYAEGLNRWERDRELREARIDKNKGRNKTIEISK